MHALGVPTTRSLALTHLPTLPVLRERVEKAAIVTRVAPSFIRIGSFQALNPPEQMFFLGGGQQSADLDALRILGEYTAKHVLRLDVEEGKPWAKALLMECARRNALMVAGWQVYGFMHGVINTDNVSIMGLTIDYGPFAFMDVYDSAHICNHSDDTGRYSFKLQPTMIIFALRALLSALAPVIGAENSTGAAVAAAWHKDIAEEDLSAWTKDGLSIQQEMESYIMTEFLNEYNKLMRKRLGLRTERDNDFKEIIEPFLGILEQRELDYSAAFRALSRFTPQLLQSAYSLQFEMFLQSLDATSQCAKPDESTEAPAELWRRWLQKFADRIEEEADEWKEHDVDWLKAREKYMLSANPRFVLRQWNRWLLIEFLNPELNEGLPPLTTSKIYHAIKNSVIINFGDAGWGAVGVSLNSKPQSKLGILPLTLNSKILFPYHLPLYPQGWKGAYSNSKSSCYAAYEFGGISSHTKCSSLLWDNKENAGRRY
ncbi:hypothetical protein FRC18_005305 [Serendipita sp. 400]|nr:hypothetical protein FRC18_005305 [Serendipita sp. 400]